MPRSLRRTNVTGLAETYRDNHVWEVMRTLVNGGTDSSRLLELYYWSQEPGVVELVRAYLEMNEQARLTVGNFMLTARPQSVVAALDASGRLVLSQPEAANGRAAKHRQSTDV